MKNTRPLIIVESPTKSRTISKFLGESYKVVASFGHVRDLPKSEFGIDVENNFEPKYIIPTKSKKTVSALKKDAAKAEQVILATDEDREGESISWHLQKALDLSNPKRIVFHEITREAIENALEHPRQIDMNLVDAQQARRALDRIVGYKLSPFLWKKISRGLSAGRVQSVAVRLVVEREREIEKFVPREYWSIEAKLRETKGEEFIVKLTKKDDKNIDKLEIKNKEEADKVLKDLEDAEYVVSDITKKETRRNPLPPFTTSTLQQTAANAFGFSAKMTMSVAQKLYEQGHITYHRTDSLNLSPYSLEAAAKLIEEKFGKKYHSTKRYKAKKGAQEAHEAIRPTKPGSIPREMGGRVNFHNKVEEKLYKLIWQRFIASQMTSAVFDSVSIEVSASKYTFLATGQLLKFKGFLEVYPMKFKENDLPDLKEKEILELVKIDSLQHFTEPPARYNEASLIKTLENYGIGRPSTYAPTLSTIQDRNYIVKNEQKRFQPTEMGVMVNDMLIEHFPEVVDIEFTAKMERELDLIAEGKYKWQKACEDFYGPFIKNLKLKYNDVKKENTNIKTDKKCPECAKEMVEKLGRFGRFYACSGFPECKHTESLEKNNLDISCPKCKMGELVAKRTKRKKIFYACNKFPKCDFALWDKPINQFCEKCNSILIQKTKNKIICSNKECVRKKH